MGLFGLWLGPICGCSVELIISIVIITWLIDWEALAFEIYEKVKLEPTKTLSTSFSEPLLNRSLSKENGMLV